MVRDGWGGGGIVTSTKKVLMKDYFFCICTYCRNHYKYRTKKYVLMYWKLIWFHAGFKLKFSIAMLQFSLFTVYTFLHKPPQQIPHLLCKNGIFVLTTLIIIFTLNYPKFQLSMFLSLWSPMLSHVVSCCASPGMLHWHTVHLAV